MDFRSGELFRRMSMRRSVIPAENELSFPRIQLPPMAGRKVAKLKRADANTDQTQGWMPDGGSHAPHLTVFALDQLNGNPTIRHGLAETDRWNAWRDTGCGFVLGVGSGDPRLWIEQPRATGQGGATLNYHSA